ncbi:MAG: hypothetical protein H7X91_06310 [Burkholderiales bacterium]|nr:hypothetical protein [Burkholderiales bacterium]
MEIREGYLYPLLVLGALSFVALSIAGIVEILQYSPDKTVPDAYKQPLVTCAECGVVEAVQQPGNPAGALPIGIGESATAQGASASVVDDSRVSSGYAIRLRMNNGATEVLYRRLKPQFDIGDRVKLVNDTMVALD